MFKIGERAISIDVPFTDDRGIRYPANWLRLSTPAMREAAGIVEVADPEPYNEYYYIGRDEQGNLIPRSISALKTKLIKISKSAAHGLLADTDWQVIKAVEAGDTVPDALKATRKAVRDWQNGLEALINACETVAQLEALDKTIPANLE